MKRNIEIESVDNGFVVRASEANARASLKPTVREMVFEDHEKMVKYISKLTQNKP